MPEAELVVINGRLRTPNGAYSQAAAIAKGHFVAVGASEDIRPLITRHTQVIDLEGRLTLAAFGDAHVHTVGGGLESLRCNLAGLKTREQYRDVITRYVKDLRSDDWVLGAGWSMDSFPGGMPEAAELDSMVGDRCAILYNRDHHSAWVSSAALLRAGITATTPDPFSGRIERDSRGNPTGALHDGAMALVGALVPEPTEEELLAGLLAGQQHLHSQGITHYQDACVGSAAEIGVADSFGAYLRAAREGLLSASVIGALWWDRMRGIEQIEELVERRETAGSGPFCATSIKIMLDGVAETETAAMSEPYLDATGGQSLHAGEPFIDQAQLNEIVTSLSERGFQVHIHAIGDLAVRMALDAYETVPRGERIARRHHIAHLQFINPHDISRFGELGVIANFQPLWACNDAQMTELTVPKVGPERATWQYLISSVAKAGGTLAFGSDWPVSSANPLQEIHVAVNRTLYADPRGEQGPSSRTPLLPQEAITLASAVKAFTEGVAFVNHQQDFLGKIAPGYRGDLCVLDKDIFLTPPDEIAASSVTLTVAAGKVVYASQA